MSPNWTVGYHNDTCLTLQLMLAQYVPSKITNLLLGTKNLYKLCLNTKLNREAFKIGTPINFVLDPPLSFLGEGEKFSLEN
jgi:hypothetical protein